MNSLNNTIHNRHACRYFVVFIFVVLALAAVLFVTIDILISAPTVVTIVLSDKLRLDKNSGQQQFNSDNLSLLMKCFIYTAFLFA